VADAQNPPAKKAERRPLRRKPGMTKAANKTSETGADAIAFVDSCENAEQRTDAHRLIAMIQRLSGHPPRMWGPSIIGFGSYHYRYESGREGDMCRIGFSPRKGQTVIYLIDGFSGHSALLARLGKHKIGKSCLYIRKVRDIDESVLEDMMRRSLANMAQAWPE
jgi:hypothetical protein